MNIPHIKYLTTLVAGKLTNKEIILDLQTNSLDAPPSKDVNELRDKLRIGQEEYFENKDAVDVAWLNELGIEAMFGHRFNTQVAANTLGIEGALRVLNDRAMYRTITSLAMANVTEEDIELIINGKYDIEYSSEDLDKFLHYFFRVKAWSYYDKESYIGNNVGTAELKMFYNMAIHEDKAYLMWKLGVAPNKSFPEMLREMTSDCFFNFKEQSTRSPDQAQKWGALMIKVSERLDKVEKDLNSDTDFQTDLAELLKSPSTKAVNIPGIEEKNHVEDNMDPISALALNSDGKEIPPIINLQDLN
jgi:hypothetical protein